MANGPVIGRRTRRDPPARAARAFVSTLALLLVLAMPAGARALGTCGEGGALGSVKQVTFDGSLYYITTPAGYAAGGAPMPLVVGLHGDEGDPARSVNSLWRGVVDGRFIFVAPKCPSGSWYKEQAANEAWLDRLLAKLFAEYNVDVDRIYVWGLSGGATFLGPYALARQGLLAAAEWNMGGSGRRYVDPPRPECKLPARFVVSPTDFLRPGALALHKLFADKGHEAVWVDAACADHCFDRVEAGVKARDWLLAHTRCGTASVAGCGKAGDLPAGAPRPTTDAGAPTQTAVDASPGARGDAAAAPRADALGSVDVSGRAPPTGSGPTDAALTGSTTPDAGRGASGPRAPAAGNAGGDAADASSGGCAMGGGQPSSALLTLLPVLLVRLRGRRRRAPTRAVSS